MSAKKLEQIYLWSIRILLGVTPFLSLFISQSMIFPYITGRNFAFRILIEIALVFWVGLMVLNRNYLPKKSVLLWALVVFLVIIGIANIFGIDSYDSFWSRYERMEGYIGLLHFGLYFFIASSVFRTKKDWEIFFTSILVAGFLVGMVAINQKISGTGSIQGGNRVDGTIGNPTYLAAYALFLLGLSLIMWRNVRQQWQRYVFGGGALFFFLIMYLTASRGPLLALGISAFFFPILFLLFGDKEKRKQYQKYAIGILVALVIGVGGFWAMRNTSLVQSSPILSRFANISLTDKTTRSRFMIWDMAWEGFKERPILGWGQENYIHVFAKYYNPKLFDQEPYFDRAHSVFFDWLINGGVLGIASYFYLFIAAFLILSQLKRKSILTFFEASVIGLTLFAYFVQNLLVFDNFTTYILFFSILAYLHALSSDPVHREDNILQAHAKTSSLFSLGTILVLITIPFYILNIRPILASQQLIQALQSLRMPNVSPRDVYDSFVKAFAYDSFGNIEIAEQLTHLTIQIGGAENISIQEKVKFLELTINSLESRIEKHPNDMRTHIILGDLYSKFAVADPTFLKKGEDHIRKAIELSPTRQTTYFLLADNLVLQNKSDEAIKVLEKAVAIEPIFIVAQGNLAFIAGNFNKHDLVESVLEDVKLLIDSGYRSGDDVIALKRVGDLYIQQQRFSAALSWYELVLKMNPNIAENHMTIAKLYLNRGNREQAIFHAKKAVELDAQGYGVEAQEFLKNLGVY